MDRRLLQILRCPVTHKGLSLARRETIGRVNAGIASGSLRNRDGVQLTGTITEALVTDDSKLLYPIADGIPVLLEGESIRLEQQE